MDIRVVIEADWVISCVSNWPSCMSSRFNVSCGRSTSLINSRDMTRALVNGDPVTDVNLNEDAIPFSNDEIKYNDYHFTLAAKYRPHNSVAIIVP